MTTTPVSDDDARKAMPTMYGIPNCDTVKKARRWLDGHAVEYAFHDYKKAGIDTGRLGGWAAKVGWDPLVNRRGTTWRKLAEEHRADLDEARAIELMAAHPSVIKRPVLEHGDTVLVGFDEHLWARILGTA